MLSTVSTVAPTIVIVIVVAVVVVIVGNVCAGWHLRVRGTCEWR